MGLQAVLNIKDYRKGASRQAIKKYIEANHKKALNPRSLRDALAKAVASGDLTQEGQRFKLPKDKRAELRKPVPKSKKTKTKTAKKKTAKKRQQRKRQQRKRQQRKRQQRK